MNTWFRLAKQNHNLQNLLLLPKEQYHKAVTLAYLEPPKPINPSTLVQELLQKIEQNRENGTLYEPDDSRMKRILCPYCNSSSYQLKADGSKSKPMLKHEEECKQRVNKL